MFEKESHADSRGFRFQKQLVLNVSLYGLTAANFRGFSPGDSSSASLEFGSIVPSSSRQWIFFGI
jgi:hypothetical protein